MLDKTFMVILQVGTLICLCAFIYMVVASVFKDLRKNAKDLNEKAGDNEVALVVIDASDESMVNKKIFFSGFITLGRAPGNTIVIEDKFASHHHAVIGPVRNLYEIEDLNSKNHTYLNNEILRGKAFLKDGDIIRIGGVTFRFER